MGLEPLERVESEALGNSLPFALVGDQVDAVAVTYLVELQMVGEAVGQCIRPSDSASTLTPCSSVQIARSAPAVCVRGSRAASPV